MSFTNPFGGSTIQPAQVAYQALTIAASVQTVWPPQANGTNTFVARINDVTASATSLTIALPPANAVSTGFDVLWNNPGANTYTLLLNDNATTLATVAPGQSVYIWLKDDSTANGIWGSMIMGVGSSNLSAGSLAGLGLTALSSTLALAPLTSTTSTTPISLTASSRGTATVWIGGTGVVNVAQTTTLGTGWSSELRNQGTGTLTLTPYSTDTINGGTAGSAITLNVGDSCWLHSTGAGALYTVGLGRSTQFNFSLLSLSLSGSSGTVTLSTTQAANTMHQLTGAKSGNVNLVVPNVVQIYYVENNTSDANTLTYKTPSTGRTLTIPTGQAALVFCDGVNCDNASSITGSFSTITISQGSAASPAININGDITTGLYQPATSQLALSITGTQRYLFTATGETIPVGAAGTPSLNFAGDTTTGLYHGAASEVDVALAGTKVAAFTTGGLAFYQANVAIGAAAASSNLYLVSNNTNQWQIDASGRLLNTAASQPTALFYNASQQTSGTKLALDTIEYNVGGFSLSSNNIALPAAGIYEFIATVTVNNISGSAIGWSLGAANNANTATHASNNAGGGFAQTTLQNGSNGQIVVMGYVVASVAGASFYLFSVATFGATAYVNAAEMTLRIRQVG